MSRKAKWRRRRRRGRRGRRGVGWRREEMVVEKFEPRDFAHRVTAAHLGTH